MGPLPTLFSARRRAVSRARAAWSAVAVGGNGAGAITRRKLTFLGEITFTKYLISSPAREESLPTAFEPRGRGERFRVAAKTLPLRAV